ncbi:MAG: multidrug efflux RND transporter permease subunit [Thermodesulfobacteriales bacterium]|nr:MAG: multidrug efflux RND transporter permease subunit [Thermodesulfobacteriales bacterium]
MVDFFINRPVLATVLAILITLIGGISIPILPIAQFPEISPPTVNVSATFTGASSEVVEETVTTPIEEQINGVEGMTYMSSDSSNDGTMSINVTFDIGYDLDIAAVDVQNRVQLATPRVPEEVSKYGISVNKQSTSLILAVNLISPDGSRDDLFLSNYIDIHISDVLKRIPGVGNLTIWGEREYSMRIWLDPDKLASLALTTTDVANAIEEQNVQVAAGSIGQPPIPKGQQFQFTITTLGRLETVEEFEDIIIRANPDGSVVRIKDVATVELGAETYTTKAELDGGNTVGIGTYQLPGANALDLAKEIRAAMELLKENFPSGVDYAIIYDTTEFVTESIKEVVITLFEAFILVFIVVFIFLQNFRATLIPAITIPVSLIGTFALINALGFSINTLTLFGLVLAIGLVVDDAIVVVENASRLIQEKGVSSREATSAAMKEVTGPIVATSLVLMAVFVPVSFMPGITGQLYRQFALTIACSVAISTINALTLSPALCALFLRKETGKKFWFFKKFDQGFDWFKDRYHGWVVALTTRWKIVVGVFAALMVLTYFIFTVVPTGFVPEEDQGYFIINVQGPEGSSLERTEETMQEVYNILMSTPGVAHIVSIAGLNFLTSASDSNTGAMFAVLEPWGKRKSYALSVFGIIERVRKEFAGIQGAVVVPFNAPPIQGLSSTGGFQFELEDRSSLGIQTLANVTNEMIEKGNQTPELTGLFSSFTADVPGIYVELDRTKAKTQGIAISDIFDTLQAYLGALYVNDFNKFGRVYRVFMQAEDSYRAKVDDISRLYVRTQAGDMVPLSTLIEVKEIVGPETVTHYNLYRSTEIDGDSASGYSSGQAIAAMEKLAEEVLPEGMGYEWSGTSYQEIKAGNIAPLIFALSIVFVFLFLAALYESWAMPFMVMLAVPLALLGAMLAQYFRGLTNDVYCQIGLVMLIGLASKNAILIVEFAKQRREDGLPVIEAAMQAAMIRLRPILMTAFAFILGVFPLVIASGAGAQSRHSLGTAVFGGMILSTMLSLIVVPVFYVVIENLRERKPKTVT